MKYQKALATIGILSLAAFAFGTVSATTNAAAKSSQSVAKKTSKRLTYGNITNNNLNRLATIRQLTRTQLAETHKLSGKQVQRLVYLPLPRHLTATNFTLDSQHLTIHLTKNQYGVKNVAIPLNKLTGIILNRYMPKKYDFTPVKTPKKVVALTFDDGPDPTLTPRLLKTLKKYNVPATFFEVGTSVMRYPSISREVLKSGNQIGNHSWSHPQLTNLSSTSALHQIALTDAAIYKATKTIPYYIRPPYGAVNARIGNLYDRPIVRWSVDSRDWAYLNTAKTISHVLATTTNGSIILMHDIHATSVAAVPQIIRSLKKRGYTFVTLEQLNQKPLLGNLQYFGRNDYRGF
ncbi:xylanase [Lentilactobacillus parafarraginis]|jgi:peptidoglycan/xylan/chitin deacetylase (PgdA/CDA1 family)|uniref:Polysaccharide deacetylase n=2 Tax=Lentilactobacillus parafarraginis TaxID=390842 RepID=A0A0R1YSJ2_9LACO|nr:polysaccharide deacetylase family protein [Lentilactobacillus parafarraginis]KRM43764.1 polysaccharide deacetylase [Lentilactobacillus parafarraginis DSM 18390 = JCM 14109]TLQ20221.1 xylanase [Lentilactobacillus parafarraginis]